MRTAPVWLTLAGGCLTVAGLDGEYTLDPSGAGGGLPPPDNASSVSASGGVPGVGGSTGGETSMGGAGGGEEENPDTCSNSPVITLDNGDVVSVSGNTRGAADDFTSFVGAGECDEGPWYGRDHVFTVMPKVSGTLIVTLDPDYDDSLLHLRDACADTTELACDYESTSIPFTFTAFVDMAQPYFVIVDSWSDTQGDYTLTVELD